MVKLHRTGAADKKKAILIIRYQGLRECHADGFFWTGGPAVTPPKERVYDDEDIPAPAPAKSSAKAPAIVPKGRRFGPVRKEPEQNAAPSEQNEQSNNSNASEGTSGVKSLTSRLGRSRFALKQ
ncbi:hypothetical protein CpipJ_CPIJ015250 [Culex quinquefasciatus]|uniref:Uncharacterized protein n=1 Tax=Culex quinquefasciatus TaxID=7176 RepID=B0X8T2_CULQU|nr:hypothetical protein CpipJ_CPIJ015250 [Culex quinquefasciatus]|eukprot:XP_001866054.1 hypothetical protein CpipJ_CPIJ015250 [Culex quinquefasciatus]